MSQAERPDRLQRKPTIDDILELSAAATPHFSLQLRARIARLIDPLAVDDPVRLLGQQEIEKLRQLGFVGEHRGGRAEPDLLPLRSASGDYPPAR